MRVKTLIYPYHFGCEPYVKYQKLVKNVAIEALVSPKGWGICGLEVQTDEKVLVVEEDFQKALGRCSTVWIVNDHNKDVPSEIVEKYINIAIEQKKEVIVFRDDMKGKFDNVQKCIIPDKFQDKIVRGDYFERLFRFNVPILFVMGMAENTDKLWAQMAIRDEMINAGFKVTSISSRSEGEIFNIHSMPQFMLEEGKVSDKIIRFNHFVKQLENKEKPDLFIIGIPGGVFPLNENKHMYFGELLFEISHAVSCDYGVLCCLFKEYSTEELFEVGNEIKRRYGVNINQYHIAPKMYDPIRDIDLDKWSGFLTIPEDYVLEKMHPLLENEKVINIRESSDVHDLVDNVIRSLGQ